MNRFTPGPWTDKSIDESQWSVYDYRGQSVAQAHQIKALSADLKQEERTANARLIAAAPDLLETLQDIADYPELDAFELKRMARAAIAKATGATS